MFMNFEEQFKNYLLQERELSKRTIKNYLSDYNHFWDWLEKVAKVTPPRWPNGLLGRCKKIQISQKITLNSLKRYRNYLSSTELAKSTVKRRLSTVRIFCQFLLSQGLLDQDPSIELENPSENSPEEEKIDNLVTKFERYLDNQGLSKNTAKNYLADIKNYLEWTTASS
jgi:site-specific recombinase XerD